MKTEDVVADFVDNTTFISHSPAWICIVEGKIGIGQLESQGAVFDTLAIRVTD